MSNPNKTANSYAIADFKTRIQLQKDDLFDLIVEDNSDLGNGPYEGEIITMSRVAGGVSEADGEGKSYYKALVRIEQLHGFQVPVGTCQETGAISLPFTTNQQKILAYCHTEAISEFPLDTNYGEELCVSDRVLKVLVKFKVSPKQKGKTRGATFTLPTTKNQLKPDSKGCYKLDCDNQGVPESLAQMFSAVPGTFVGTGGSGAENPPLTSKLTRQTKDGVKRWPRAYVVKPNMGSKYDDVYNCPFLNFKGVSYFAKEPAGGSTPGQAKNVENKETTLLGREYIKLLAGSLSFDITMTSNYRSPPSNASIMTNIVYKDREKNTGGLGIYGNRGAGYKKDWARYKTQTGESNPVKQGKTWNLMYAQLLKYYKNKKDGHSIGSSLDISARRLSRKQVADVLWAHHKLDAGFGMLEHDTPHIHLNITPKGVKFKSTADCNDPAKVKQALDILAANKKSVMGTS